MVAGLVLALLVDRELPAIRIIALIIVWPYTIARAALGLLFAYMMAPDAGVIFFSQSVWPGIWVYRQCCVKAMGTIIVAFGWKYIECNFSYCAVGAADCSRSPAAEASFPWTAPA